MKTLPVGVLPMSLDEDMYDDNIYEQIHKKSIEDRGEIEKDFEDHKGRPGMVGGSLPRDYSTTPPSLPPQLNRGPVGLISDRQKLRVAILEETYPGIKFSRAIYNVLAFREHAKIPGIGIPRAIFDPTAQEIESQEIIDKLIDSQDKLLKEGGLMVSFNMLKYDTGLDFETIFGVLNWYRKENPYKITFSPDRMGYNTSVRIRR